MTPTRPITSRCGAWVIALTATVLALQIGPTLIAEVWR